MNEQLLIVGIGGQGVLFATNLLGEAAMSLGLQIIGSETHGMSQRGGSVVSHLRIGNYHGPLICKGTARIILGFERNEFLRSLPAIAPQGMCFGSVPVDNPVPESVLAILKDMQVTTVLLDARAIAVSLGMPNLTNVVLLGAATATPGFPFSFELLETTLKRIAPKKFRDINCQALKEGYNRVLKE